tara:strand:+ start:2155 stop:2451 length:297 start_codon:yes stop_codon:yes gene_type:complete
MVSNKALINRFKNLSEEHQKYIFGLVNLISKSAPNDPYADKMFEEHIITSINECSTKVKLISELCETSSKLLSPYDESQAYRSDIIDEMARVMGVSDD